MSYVEIGYEYVHETDDAVLVLINGDKEWVPKSMIRDGHDLDFSEDYDLGFEMEIVEWFAIKKGFV